MHEGGSLVPRPPTQLQKIAVREGLGTRLGGGAECRFGVHEQLVQGAVLRRAEGNKLKATSRKHKSCLKSWL